MTYAHVAVFLHMWAPNPAAAPATAAIATEMLRSVPTAWPVYATAVASATPIERPNTITTRVKSGYETVTLEAARSFCLRHRGATVIYMHTKGAFHPSSRQIVHRRRLVAAATSPACTRMPEHCDVCGARVSPLASPHVPGNMWAARCRHVAGLLPPAMWQAEATRRYDKTSGNWHPRWLFGRRPLFCRGASRYADEFWLLSRPNATGCDIDAEVYPGPTPETPLAQFDSRALVAPRFPRQLYRKLWSKCTEGDFAEIGRLRSEMYLLA